MKKVLVVFVLIMAVLAVNAQQIPEDTKTKVKPVRTTVEVADLQKAITDNIEKDYVGYTVKEATKVVKEDVVKYEVVIVKDNETETLYYDNDGKFLKKLDRDKEKK